MLFDLRGRRKRLVQVTYMLLAILFGGGLVLVGAGSGGPGGLLDAFKGGGVSSNSQLAKQVKQAQAQTKKNPRSEQAFMTLARTQFTLAASPEGADQETGDLTDDGKQAAIGGVAAWEHYLRLKPKKPNAVVAQFAAQAYSQLGDAPGAVKAQQILVKNSATANNWAQLSLFAYANGKNELGAKAAKEALALTAKADRNTVKSTLEQQEKDGKKFYKATQKLLKEQRKQQKAGGQTGTSPGGGFGPLPGQTPAGP